MIDISYLDGERRVFVDTSAWFSIIDRNEEYHTKLQNLYQQLIDNNFDLITTNLVIGETYTLMRYRLGVESKKPFTFLDMVQSSRIINIIVSRKNLEETAIKLLKKYDDHKFSYVDAVSFAVMDKLDLNYALTLNQHFEIAGYSTLPNH